jgi:hypothetical protein
MKQDPVENPMENAQFEAELDAALRSAPGVHAPPNFRQRLMTQLPEAPEIRRVRTWQMPVVIALVLLFCGALTAFAFEMGFAGWLAQPSILLVLLGIETAAAGTWLWRMVSR